MADFTTPSQDVTPPDYTNVSQGPRAAPNDALGNLFQNVAQIADAGIKEADRYQREKITDEIIAGVDAVQAEFGVPDATDGQLDAEAGGVPLPPQLARAGEQLDYLQNAYEKGGIKQSHYWARLNVMVRQLRAKYPGYRQDIDNMVAGVVGAKPANALQQSLFSEWNEAANAANASGKDFAQYVERADFLGLLPADYYERQAAGNPYTETETKVYVSRQNREKALDEQRRAELSEAAAQNALNKTEATAALQERSAAFTNQIFYNATTRVGASWQKFDAIFTDINNGIESGVNPEQYAGTLEQMKAGVNSLIAEAQIEIEKIYRDPFDPNDPSKSFASYVSASEWKDIKEAALAPFFLLQETLAGSSNPTAMVKALAAWNETQMNIATAQQMQAIPYTANLAALNKAVGPDITKYIIERRDQSGSSVLEAYSTHFAAAMSQGTADVEQALDAGESTNQPPKYFDNLMNQWQKIARAIDTGDLPLEIIQNNVRAMFGNEGSATMAKMDEQSRLLWYSKVSSPEVTAYMAALRKIDPDSWNMYANWTKGAFVSLFDTVMNDLNGANELLARGGHMAAASGAIKWDPDTSTFQADITWNRDFLGINEALNNVMPGGIGATVRYLNQAIQGIKPIIEEDGSDIESSLGTLLMTMGYDGAQGFQKAMFDELVAAYMAKNPQAAKEE